MSQHCKAKSCTAAALPSSGFCYAHTEALMGPTTFGDEAKTSAPKLKEPYPVTAADILHTAAQHMQDRATTYDQPQGERSISKTVTMFNTLTGHGLTDEQGWLFMTCLKMVRAQAGGYRADSYEDGAAYFALAGESAAQERV